MKFFNLLQKELRELINRQMIIGLLVTLGILMALGQFMGDAMEKAVSDVGDVYIMDNDGTDFTSQIIERLKEIGYNVEVKKSLQEDSVKILEELNIDNLIVIPKGFTESILSEHKASEIEFLSKIKSMAMMENMSDASSAVVESLKSTISYKLMHEGYGLNEDEINLIKNNVTVKDVTVVGEKSADVNTATIISMSSTQGIVVPLVIFMLVMFTSQLIISAISTEKIDKTLETLLSAPVSRIAVLGSKMLSAAIIALINAVVYMVGFSNYMGGMMGNTLDMQTVSGALKMSQVLEQLGLNMSAGDYVLLGLQMFMTIMISLSISLILGAMVNDAKSAQTIMMPVMFSAMIPYMITLFADINSLSPILRILVWAIPFTHTFTAINNIMFGNWEIFWGGFVYQVLFFAVCMFFALRLFTSDKIFTISLNLGQKRKLKKAKTR